jgi:hypothetical protein
MDTEGDQQDTKSGTKGTTPARARVTATERRRRRDSEAAVLRAQGLSYDDIADALGYSGRSAAHKSVQRALSDVVRQSTDEARVLAQQRLDALRRMLVNLVTEGAMVPRDCIAAARALLAVEEREAKLLGLDITAAPVVTGDVLDAEIARLTREIGALDALPVRDPWEDWTPADRVADDVHRNGQHHPGAEIVPFRTNGHDRGDRR